MHKLSFTFLVIALLLALPDVLVADDGELPMRTPLAPETLEALSVPFSREQLLDFLFELQGAAATGDAERLRELLSQETFEKLE